MTLGLRWGAATDAGRLRPVNEDSAHAEEGLFVVADGMGGHAAGDVASRLAVETVRSVAASVGLVEAVRRANAALMDLAADDPEVRGMGTTITAAAVVDDDGGSERLEVVNVGDSRAYLFRDGDLLQLTDDHSLVAELERDGRITAAEARVHPQRNIVTRVLGHDPDLLVDVFPVDPFRGDRLVLCSDGLFNEVAEADIADVLARVDDPVAAAGELVDLANRAGGRDNITVVLVDVVDDGGRAESASAALAGRAPVTSAGRAAVARTATSTVDTEADDRPAGAAPPPAPPTRRRFADHVTWRSTLFVIALLAVVLGALGATWWAARSTYYVGLDGDDVAIFRGRPGGLLVFDPILEEGTDLTIGEVPARVRADVEDGHQVSSLAAARRYVRSLGGTPDASPSNTTTTTSTAPPTTTTTPPAPSDTSTTPIVRP